MAHSARREGYVPSGDLNLYYDIEGDGPPLLLFHGGMGTISMFEALRSQLSRHWMTVGIEQQGHGHTADIDRPLRFPQMADDSAKVIRHLGLKACHAFGYSDGGNVALGLAIRHPELVDRVAICGTNANNDGLQPKMLEHLVEGAKQDPNEVASSLPDVLRDAYRAVAPEPDHWPQLVHRVFEQAATFPGWSDTDLQGLRTALLVIVGDHDVVTPEHALWLSRTCPNGHLCILPRSDHLAPVARAAWIATILTDFLQEDLTAPLPMEAAHD